ncbi:hypothetical protein [Asanoa siamensis]|uniref:Uncharacterized protein n=1 Tax=Asanoa siamensis TaxID=926357 RepID=A0ABQ4D3R6_9ACTN|nr:hypothetical protein [Asanoa siamensis]GIF77767.1 hypothetical protein Asi02nite_72850 [Asanoa siamensis]
MTDIATPRSPSGGQESTTQKAKDEARDVGKTAAAAGGDVAQTAKEQGKEVARETARQARDLYGEARGHLRDQAGSQQRRAAGGIRALGDELRGMAENSNGSGPAGELARQASGRISDIADWLEAREPGELVTEVKEFARRHPGTFLAGAAVLGVLAGRMTRGLVADAHDDDSRARTTDDPTAAYPTGAPPAAYPPETYATGTPPVTYPTGTPPVTYPTGTPPVTYPTDGPATAYPAAADPMVGTATYPTVRDSDPDSTVYAGSTADPAVVPEQPVERGPWDERTRP